ncbi:MAG: hypothetical protein ABFD49_02130 [Armatimonadota bacterium]|nr:hypothetical protein [bacterium]
MRMLYILLIALIAPVLVGCGGGGGGSSDNDEATVALTVPTGTTITDGSGNELSEAPTVTIKSADSFTPSMESDSFVAAATCEPAGAVFSNAVTLTFHLAAAVESGASLALFQSNASNSWNEVSDYTLNVSADRLTLTVEVSSFSAYEDYVILVVPT